MIRYQRSADITSTPIHVSPALQRGQLLLAKLPDGTEFADHPTEAGQHQASDEAGQSPRQRPQQDDNNSISSTRMVHEDDEREHDQADADAANDFQNDPHMHASACDDVGAYRARGAMEILAPADGDDICFGGHDGRHALRNTAIVVRMARTILSILAEKPTVTVDDIIRRGWSRLTVMSLGPEAVERARKALADHRSTMATN